MELKHKVLLAVGAVAFAKGIAAFGFPQSMRRAAAWWLKAVGRLSALVGWVCCALGVALWAVVLADQPLSCWILGALGLLFSGAGVLYLRRETFQRCVRAAVLDRPDAVIRLLGLAGLALAGWILWVALKGL